MDFSTVTENLVKYESVEDGIADIRLIWNNCMEFNAEESVIYSMAKDMSEIFDQLLIVRVFYYFP